MPYRRRTFHSFIFPSHSRRDSFSLPDYYRQTRLEQYGPYYMSSESARDLMKTIDLRGRESNDSICALPDIPEEDELELDDMAFKVVAKLNLKDDKFVHNGTELPHEREKKEKRLGRLWRQSSSLIRKCWGRRVVAVKSAGRNVDFDLSA